MPSWVFSVAASFMSGLEPGAWFTSVVVRDHDIVARLGQLTPRQEGQEPASQRMAIGLAATCVAGLLFMTAECAF